VLMQRLWALQMQEGDNMPKHLNKFRELANEVESLSATGKGVDTTELVTLLSLSLPESYEPIIMALQSRWDDITFDIFASRLLQEAARRYVANIALSGDGLNSAAPSAAFSARFTTRGRAGV